MNLFAKRHVEGAGLEGENNVSSTKITKVMKRLSGMLVLGAVVLGTCFTACERTEPKGEEMFQASQVQDSQTQGEIIPNQYVVLLRADMVKPALQYLDPSTFRSREEKGRQMEVLNANVRVELDKWLAKFDLQESQILNRFTAMQVGATIEVDAATYAEIKGDAAVAVIEPNKVERLTPYVVSSIEPGNSRAQTVPCGITNTRGYRTAPPSRWIWIVDTGIELTHPDLNVVTNPTYAVSFVGGGPGDCTGHGTHLAGTAAAIDNTIGVVGVSAGAPVVPVRVFDCSGAGSTSTIMDGLSHVASYAVMGDVVNLGFGGASSPACSTSSIYIGPITSLGSMGIRVSMSAGSTSSASSSYQPGCISGVNVYTTTSMFCAKTWGGSNFGMPSIDFIATGRGVLSTYLNGGYAILDGSAMAAAHVTGIMHLRNAPPLLGGVVTHLGVNYPIAVW